MCRLLERRISEERSNGCEAEIPAGHLNAPTSVTFLGEAIEGVNSSIRLTRHSSRSRRGDIKTSEDTQYHRLFSLPIWTQTAHSYTLLSLMLANKRHPIPHTTNRPKNTTKVSSIGLGKSALSGRYGGTTTTTYNCCAKIRRRASS